MRGLNFLKITGKGTKNEWSPKRLNDTLNSMLANNFNCLLKFISIPPITRIV